VSSGNGVSLPAADGLRLEIVDPAGTATHLTDWEDLAGAAEEANVFLSPFMLLPACRAFGGRRQLRLCFFYAPHPTHKLQPPVLVGFAALEERRSRLRLPIPILGSFHHPAIHLGTPICRPGYTRKVVEALLDHIGQRRRVVTLHEIRGDGPFHEALLDGLNRRGWTHVGLRRATRALLLPDASAEAYLQRALVGKRRKELRRQRDRLGEQGVLEFVTLSAGEDPRPWLDAFLSLESAGWKGKDEDGEALAATPETRAFFLEAMTEGHRQGGLHLTALRLDGAFIAMKCNLLAGDGSFAFKITFDERYARFSPGVQLELETIRWFHEPTNLKRTRWMDSCAHHSRFMINHLWSARRPVESMAFATGHATAALLVALLPAVGWARERLSRQEANPPPSKQLPTPAAQAASTPAAQAASIPAAPAASTTEGAPS
jgi:hypothetical protein